MYEKIFVAGYIALALRNNQQYMDNVEQIKSSKIINRNLPTTTPTNISPINTHKKIEATRRNLSAAGSLK